MAFDGMQGQSGDEVPDDDRAVEVHARQVVAACRNGHRDEAAIDLELPLKLAVGPVPETDPTIGFKIGGQSKLFTLRDDEAAEKLVGKEAAKGLITNAVDFTMEQIVLVSWTTAGPPDGMLMHETNARRKTSPQGAPPSERD